MESEQGWRTKGGRTFHNDPSCEWLHSGETRLRLIGKDAHEIVEVRRTDVGPGQLQPCDYCCAPTWLERHGQEHRADEKPCLVLSEDEWWRGTLVWEPARRADGLWWATVTYDKKGQHLTEVHSQHDIRAR